MEYSVTLMLLFVVKFNKSVNDLAQHAMCGTWEPLFYCIREI